MLKGKYWLVFGLLSYLAIFGYGLFFSLNNSGLLINLQIITSWFSASVIYFFIGASFGALIDKFTSKYKTELPLFFNLVIVLFVICIFVSVSQNPPNFVFPAIFPIIYGIFLTGSFYTLFPDFLKDVSIAQFVFDLFFATLFTFWLYFEILNKKHYSKRIALIIMFIILTVGAVKSIFIFF